MMATIDTHQHLWDLETLEYDWLDETAGPLFRTFGPDEIKQLIEAAGVDKTILVQAADTYADTFSMFEVATRFDFVIGVVGWIPLDRPAEAAQALACLASNPTLRGIRNLNHTYPDVDWIIQRPVIETLKLLAERDLVFEIIAVVPRHLEHVPTLAEAVPDLRIVIDHLAKPPIADGGWEPWASLLTAAASHPNVSAKISGLNTAADPQTWGAADLQPYVDHAIDVFGSQRLMFGGDWPVATLAGTYQRVFDETTATIAHLPANDQAAILGGTAAGIYNLSVDLGD